MFGKIKSFFKKDKKMQSEILDSNTLTEKFKDHDFQWIKGDHFMATETFSHVSESGEDLFVNFKSGRRINNILLEEYLTWFPSPPAPQVVAPIQEQPKPQQAEVTSIKYGETVSPTSSKVTESPIYNLLSRQKKNDVEIGINIKVPLPSKDLFNVLVSSFDDAESEIVQFIIDSIDLEDIRSTLSRSIRENYYGIQEKKSKGSNNKIKEQDAE
jgi:hypothetical protein